MSTFDAHKLFHNVAGILNAQVHKVDIKTFQFEFEGHPILLRLYDEETMPYITGRITLRQLNLEQDATQVLLSMYLNFSLPEKNPFPIWFAIDPHDDVLYAMFHLSHLSLTEEFLAKALSDIMSAIVEAQNSV